MSGLQNNSWRYWNHFHTIQPNAATKGQRAFQPSYHANDNNRTPSSMDTTIPVDDPMSIDSIPATPATAEKRPLEVINLDSDRKSGTHNCPSSSTMVGSGSKTTLVGSSWKAHNTSISSTAHSSSGISGSSGLIKPSSVTSKSFMSQSGLSVQSSSSLLYQGTSKHRQPKIWAMPLPQWRIASMSLPKILPASSAMRPWPSSWRICIFPPRNACT